MCLGSRDGYKSGLVYWGCSIKQRKETSRLRIVCADDGQYLLHLQLRAAHSLVIFSLNALMAPQRDFIVSADGRTSVSEVHKEAMCMVTQGAQI